MKGMSVSVEAASVPSAARDANTRSAVFDPHLLIIGLWVFAGYYLGCKIGFALTFQPHPISVLWPPNSVLVAALLLTPPRSWWVVLLAALPAHLAAQLQSHVPPLMIFGWFLSNSCEALIGAGLLRYLVGGPIRSVHRPVLVVVFRRRACRMEPLGRGHLLGANPSTPFFKRPRGIDNCAVSRDVGDDWNPATADSPTIALLGSMRALCWSVARKLRGPL